MHLQSTGSSKSVVDGAWVVRKAKEGERVQNNTYMPIHKKKATFRPRSGIVDLPSGWGIESLHDFVAEERYKQTKQYLLQRRVVQTMRDDVTGILPSVPSLELWMNQQLRREEDCLDDLLECKPDPTWDKNWYGYVAVGLGNFDEDGTLLNLSLKMKERSADGSDGRKAQRAADPAKSGKAQTNDALSALATALKHGDDKLLQFLSKKSGEEGDTKSTQLRSRIREEGGARQAAARQAGRDKLDGLSRKLETLLRRQSNYASAGDLKKMESLDEDINKVETDMEILQASLIDAVAIILRKTDQLLDDEASSATHPQWRAGADKAVTGASLQEERMTPGEASDYRASETGGGCSQCNNARCARCGKYVHGRDVCRPLVVGNSLYCREDACKAVALGPTKRKVPTPSRSSTKKVPKQANRAKAAKPSSFTPVTPGGGKGRRAPSPAVTRATATKRAATRSGVVDEEVMRGGKRPASGAATPAERQPPWLTGHRYLPDGTVETDAGGPAFHLSTLTSKVTASVGCCDAPYAGEIREGRVRVAHSCSKCGVDVHTFLSRPPFCKFVQSLATLHARRIGPCAHGRYTLTHPLPPISLWYRRPSDLR